MGADMEIDTASSNEDTQLDSSSLLSCVKDLVQVEMSLTEILETTKPLLGLATPKNMSEVNSILSLARTYSTRTSAPPGWNPNLPVIHFSTPNPLPHQLRQGALGAMELNLVKEERMAKRRKMEQELLNKKAEEEQRRNAEANKNNIDPKKMEVINMDNKVVDRKMAGRKQEPKVASFSMNLSDSDDSSSEDDSESD
ncbi:hypothetical protein CTEN210_14433 [Chaetoceros tenuissimus]|uniref:Mediator of RNA polymerase II transcription subunit 4 n=1 Tax=Chaetoceros tenuissimus TaxID=426638 RepID=A0AAD3D4W4_9STRA|nr:hypothetical protein CTEN210_14433 [Chaetoceros tenuissimus]